ncbi:glycosyltransferase [Chloroflexota bacterium]
MNRKRVLFVLPSLAGGGAERAASLLLQHLDRQKFDSFLAVFQDRFDYPVPEDVMVTCFHKSGTYGLFRLIWQLKRVYEEEKPDTVVSVMIYANLFSIVAKKLSRAKPQILLTEQNMSSIGRGQGFLSPLKSWAIPLLYSKADGIICVSRGVAEDLVTQFKVPRQKIKVIFNPVDIEHVSSLVDEEVDHPYFTSKETPIIIAMGRLVVAKGYPYLIKAFAQVVAQFPCRLIILGDGKEKEALQKLVRHLGIERWVDFLGFQKNPFKYLAQSDIFVLSSLWEGFPLAIMEAMACGIPVVSTRCPSGPDEIITNGVNGLLAPVADDTELAVALLRLLNDRSFARRLAQAGRQRVEDFTVAKITQEYEALF